MRTLIAVCAAVALVGCHTPQNTSPKEETKPQSVPPLPPLIPTTVPSHPVSSLRESRHPEVSAPAAPIHNRTPSHYEDTQLSTNENTATVFYPYQKRDWSVEGRNPWTEYFFNMPDPTRQTNGLSWPRGEGWVLEMAQGTNWIVYNGVTNTLTGSTVRISGSPDNRKWRVRMLGPL